VTWRFDVCVVGSANLDLVATADRIPLPGETVLGVDFAEHPGGKGLNQAVAAARCGATTAFCGALGGDAAAGQLTDVMDGDGIDRTTIQQLPGVPTGRAMISVSADGENSIIVIPGANAALHPEHVRDIAASASVLIVQLEIPLATVQAALEAARSAGATTILNPAPAVALAPETLALCDVIVPNEHEAELLGGVDDLLRLGAKAVVVTMGSRGARLFRPGADPVAIEPFLVEPVDTTAAGDAFCGGLAASLAKRSELLDALRFASACGALATTRAGAVPSLPRRSEVEALLRTAS
jgi:ribokinase